MITDFDVLGRKGLFLISRVSQRHLTSYEPLQTGKQTGYIVASIILVCVAGLAAGLTLGLLSLDR